MPVHTWSLAGYNGSSNHRGVNNGFQCLLQAFQKRCHLLRRKSPGGAGLSFLPLGSLFIIGNLVFFGVGTTLFLLLSLKKKGLTKKVKK